MDQVARRQAARLVLPARERWLQVAEDESMDGLSEAPIAPRDELITVRGRGRDSGH
jgi:hypothetical protein